MTKRINRYEFKRILRNIPEISQKEREYLNRVFARDLIDGLTPWELKQKIGNLYFNQKDEIDQWELAKVKNRLLREMEK